MKSSLGVCFFFSSYIFGFVFSIFRHVDFYKFSLAAVYFYPDEDELTSSLSLSVPRWRKFK